MKLYRFFYHYHKARKCMSIHFRGKCFQAKNIHCWVPCETKWNKCQPNLVMQGMATGVRVRRDHVAVID